MDYEYWVIDGRSASVKIIARTPGKKAEVFYFNYWDDAWKFYLQHSRCNKEEGIPYSYDFQQRFNREWFICQQETNYLK